MSQQSSANSLNNLLTSKPSKLQQYTTQPKKSSFELSSTSSHHQGSVDRDVAVKLLHQQTPQAQPKPAFNSPHTSLGSLLSLQSNAYFHKQKPHSAHNSLTRLPVGGSSATGGELYYKRNSKPKNANKPKQSLK